MPFKFFWGESARPMDRIEAKVQEMLTHNRYEFDLAMSALLGDVVPKEVNDDLRLADRKVNRLEREIRRELIVHSSVFGGIDTPVVLVYMSIVKDVERVGDYAKNLLDLALDGANFGTLPDVDEWRRLAKEISKFIVDSGAAFRTRDAKECRSIRATGDELLVRFDTRVSALVKAEDVGEQSVARALAYRYLKRVVAHLMNLLSAVVMPLDQLDYYIQDPENRANP
jgi:phosphate uptake regulator